MGKLFDGKIVLASGIKFGGGQPLDDRSVVSLYSDLTNEATFKVGNSSTAYKGMLVAVVETEQVYMLIDKENITSEDSWVAVGSGNGSLAVETYRDAIALATNDNIGQVIYVKTESSYDADGEGPETAKTYDAAPYIVIGAGQLQKLAASSASGNIDGDVDKLKTKVSTLEGEMDTAQADILKKVDNKTYTTKVGELETAIEGAKKYAEEKASAAQTAAIEAAAADAESKASAAETAAKGHADGLNTAMGTRVKSLEDNKDAYIAADAALEEKLQAEIDKKVASEEGKRLMTNEEGTKLVGIAENAQVNVIEVVKVNGTALTIAEADKSVDVIVPTAPVQGVGADEKIITLNGDKLETKLTIAYVGASVDEEGRHVPAQLRLQGKDNAVISSINADAFVKDGMIESVVLDGPKEGEAGNKYMVITWNLDSGKEVMRLDVSELFNPYIAGDGLDLSEGTFSIKLDANEEYLTVGTAGLATTQALWTKVTELDNTVLDSAKKYAEEKASAAQTAAIEAAAADAESKAGTAKSEAIASAKEYSDGLNTAMNTRVEALEAIDHEHKNKEVLDGITAEKVSIWDSAEQNAKTYANETFVTKEGFNEFEAGHEEKLKNIDEYAQVNVIEKVTVNGIEATITNKEAEVKVEADDIELGTAITTDGTALKDDNSNLKYAANDKLSTVLQSIYSSIRAADAGGVKSITSADASVEVNSNDINNPTVRVKVSAEENNLLSVKDDGLFVVMYYDGDDVE